MPGSEIPPFPEGSDWAEPAPVPVDDSAVARFRRLTGLVVLWGSVVAFVVITAGLLRADEVVYDATNTDDVGALDGLNAFLVVVVGVVLGLLPLVAAVRHSVRVARRKQSRTRRAAGLVAVYTAACGAVTTPVWIRLTAETAQDRRIDAAGIAEATQLFWGVGLVGLVPLVVFLLTRRPARTPRGIAGEGSFR